MPTGMLIELERSGGNGDTGPRLYEVVVTASAEADISAAHGWLSMQVSTDYADRWQDGLLEHLHRLTFHPAKFAVAPESDILALELRRMLYYGPSGRHRRGQVAYRVLYSIVEPAGGRESGEVYVVRVLHGSKEPMTTPLEFADGSVVKDELRAVQQHPDQIFQCLPS